MPIAIKCPCGRRIVVNDRVAGKRIRCPDCNDICEVPLASAEQRIPNDVNSGATKEKSIAAPAATIPSQQFEDPQSFQVSGQDINCGPILVLPAICVATGDRVEIVEIKTTFMYRPDALILLGPVYWLVYYVFRRGTHRCRVTYYLSRKILVLKRRLRIAAVALLLGSFAVFWHGVTMNRVDITPLYIGLFLLVAAAVTHHFSFSPLSAAAFDGKRIFRIQGFTPAFHEAGRAMYAAGAASKKRQQPQEKEILDFKSPTPPQTTKRPKQQPDAM